MRWDVIIHSHSFLYGLKVWITLLLRRGVYGILGIDPYLTKKKLDVILSFFSQQGHLKILDVGCGLGYLLKDMDGRYPFSGYGLDISKSMIFKAKTTNPSMTFFVGDCLSLPFKGLSFDLVIMGCVLHHLRPGDVSMALEEAKRVSREALIVLEVSQFQKCPLAFLYSLYWTIMDGGYRYRTDEEWDIVFGDERNLTKENGVGADRIFVLRKAKLDTR